MPQKSEFRAFTAVWLCLLAYSGLFALLQAVILPPLHLPEGVTLILCACLSALPLLWYAGRSGIWRICPVIGVQRPAFPAFLYLFSLNLILNLTVSLSAPAIEHALRVVGIGIQQGTPSDGSSSLVLAFYICILGPILEELIYRGVILRKLLPYGTRLAILLAALCFGLMHHDLYQGLSAALGGIVYGFVAVRYSLAASICLHIANNSTATLLPLLKNMGTSGSLTIVLIFFIAALFVLIGSILAIRRRSFLLPEHIFRPSKPGAILSHPALWAVLVFDTVFLIVTNFIRI